MVSNANFVHLEDVRRLERSMKKCYGASQIIEYGAGVFGLQNQLISSAPVGVFSRGNLALMLHRRHPGYGIYMEYLILKAENLFSRKYARK